MAWHHTNTFALLARLSTNQSCISMTEVCQVESILMLAGTETILTFPLPYCQAVGLSTPLLCFH